MPRAPRFMPWLLLLLLLLSLPHTQAAFPQDPLPLLTSDLQGECPVLGLVCELSTRSRQLGSWTPRLPPCVGGQVREGSRLRRLRADDRRGELAPQVSRFSKLLDPGSTRFTSRQPQAASPGGSEHGLSQRPTPEQVQTLLTSRVTLVRLFTLSLLRSPQLQDEDNNNILPRGLT